MKYHEMAKFWAMLSLKGSDQARFGSLLTEWCQAFANYRDLYPQDLVNIVDVARVIPQKMFKKTNIKEPTKTEDLTPVE